MGQDEKQRQKALQRKAAKQKERQKQKAHTNVPVISARGPVVPRSAAEWPVHECLVSRHWDREGELTQVLVARRGPTGEIAAAAFVVDLGCLGVKDALVGLFPTVAGYSDLRKRIRETQQLVPADLNLAAKIIREGLAYARQLGFYPHRDYHRAALLLADADPDACDAHVPLGKDGKPFYVAGPFDNPRRVVAQLTRAVGPGNFDYVVMLDELPDELSAAVKAEDLVQRSADLKHELLEFARARFGRALRKFLEASLGKPIQASESVVANIHDHFILQHRLDDGLTVVDHFVAAHPELPEAERAMLLGWREVVEGVFAIQRQEGEALVVLNLVDDLTYRVRSNMGPTVFAKTPPGSFLSGRLVPVGDEWLISGYMGTWPASHQADALRIAADIAHHNPALLFRNPEKLKQAWEMQRLERHYFIEFFGSDLVVVPGRELAERVRAYMHYRTYEVRDEEGLSSADRAKAEYGVVPSVPDKMLPADLLEADTVGLIYDEIEGMYYLPNFGDVEEVFRMPELVSDRRRREAVLVYLEEPSIPPAALRRLAERNPDNASRVFQRVLKQPDFSWQRDGEALLRRYKPSYFVRPLLPGITPMTDALARAQIEEMTSEQGTPVPGGSWQRAKKAKRRK